MNTIYTKFLLALKKDKKSKTASNKDSQKQSNERNKYTQKHSENTKT